MLKPTLKRGGGHLATIRNAAENSWIFQNITSQQSNLNPWFGWNDADGNGVWQLASGEAVTYVNWGAGEPNFGHQYGNLFESTSPNAGKWNNTINGESLYAVVEVVPEPTCMSLLLIGGMACAAMRFPKR
ncbi:MAG: lectin-like protein [Verrucomicrobiota bacterium]